VRNEKEIVNIIMKELAEEEGYDYWFDEKKEKVKLRKNGHYYIGEALWSRIEKGGDNSKE
jgi:hypothetical protein